MTAAKNKLLVSQIESRKLCASLDITKVLISGSKHGELIGNYFINNHPIFFYSSLLSLLINLYQGEDGS